MASDNYANTLKMDNSRTNKNDDWGYCQLQKNKVVLRDSSSYQILLSMI